jgi:hypothetical protein
MKKFETEEIVSAYLRTGSVWKAGKLLGMAGQSVHERLRAIGHPLSNRRDRRIEITLREHGDK